MTTAIKTIGERLVELDAEDRRLMDEWWAGKNWAERGVALRDSWAAGATPTSRESAWKHWKRKELHRAKRLTADENNDTKTASGEVN